MTVPVAPAPLVTVITPVFNGQRYLAECIESVLAQTYSNWEYIIVDNRSTDATLEIAERYARRDRRIRVQTNPEFVGVLQNHNIAFRQMSLEAKYCKVVQADDWLFPECLSRMVAVAEANPSVGIVSAYALEGVQVKSLGIPYHITTMPGHEFCRVTLLGQLYVDPSPTSLLFRGDLIRGKHAFYNEANLHADFEAYFEVLQRADFGFVHQILIYLRRHDESVSSTVATPLNTYVLAWLNVLRRYGRTYLGADEYARLWQRRYDEYYLFLAQSVFRLRGKKFWDYHRQELGRMGYPFSPLKLLGATLRKAITPFLEPARAFSKTWTFVKRERNAPGPGARSTGRKDPGSAREPAPREGVWKNLS